MMMRAHCLGKSIGVTFANKTAISFQQKGWFNLTETAMIGVLSTILSRCMKNNMKAWLTVMLQEDEPQQFNYDGAPVEREEDAYGRKTQFELAHPAKVIFVDEHRSNTPGKK